MQAFPEARQSSERGRMGRAAAVASALLMLLAAAVVVLQDGASPRGPAVGGVQLSAAKLWESDDSPHHNPYYNIFDDGSSPAGAYAGGHKQWTKEAVRERVWQTLKDVKAMERHVREQNALNNKMKLQISSLEAEAQDEKLVIRNLIAQGMSDVTDKISLLKNAAMANVSDVREMLLRIEAEQKEKQMQQDTQIDDLTARHQKLQEQTVSRFNEVDEQISAAEKRLAEAKARVANEREEVKKLIMEKIRTDVGGLDQEMTNRLENEKHDIRTTIDAGLQQLDGNISDYSLATGIRVARLMNKVTVLKKDQEDKAKVQDKSIKTLEDDHKALKEQTLGTLKALRTEVDETKQKLSDAQKTLEAEQALRQSAQTADLNKQAEKLRTATEQQLSDAKDALSLKIGESDDWAKKEFTGAKDSLHQRVDSLADKLVAFEKKAKILTEDQQKAISDSRTSAAQQLSQEKKKAVDVEGQVQQTESVVKIAKAKLSSDIADSAKKLRVQLLDRMTALQDKMATSLAQVRTELQGQVASQRDVLVADLASAKATATGAMATVEAELATTAAQTKQSHDVSKTELSEFEASEKELSTSTETEMTALQAEMTGIKDSMAEAREKLMAQALTVEAQLRDKLDVAFKALNVSVGSPLLASRGDAEAKMKGDMAQVGKAIAASNAAALSEAEKLNAKVTGLETDAQTAARNSKAQVAVVAKEHAAFEAHTLTTLAHVSDSLSATKVALAEADAAMQAQLAQREEALRTKVESQITALADATVEKVDTEENGVKAAHTALEQVIAAHKAAMLATVSERKVKLEQLAADLKVLQQKMQAMHGASGKSRTSELAASAQVAAVAPAAEVAAHATLADTAKHAAKAAEKRPGVVKALPPNDRAARDPRPLAMADGDQKPRSYKSKASDSYFAKALPR